MPRKILLADDSVTIQKVVELTFSEGDYQVTCVSNGKMAVDQLGANRPDIIICDIIMPEMSGYDVAEFVKRNPLYSAIPVILLTGTFEPFDEDRARKSGAEAYVTKPFDSKMLVDKVESLLAQKVQVEAVQAIPPATMFQGGSEYQLPGVVSDEAVKNLDAQMHPPPSLESYDFPDSPVIEGEIPAVAPPPEVQSFDSPVVEDLTIPAEKGEPADLKGFDAIMEPPMPAEAEPQSVLEATASSIPPSAEGFRAGVPPPPPAFEEPELPETPYPQETAGAPEVEIEAPPPAEEPKIESFASDLVASDVADSSFAAEEHGVEESSIPDLPEAGTPEPEISIGETEAQLPSFGEPPAGQAAVEPETAETRPGKFFEPPVFEPPPALQGEGVESAEIEAPVGFMEIPPVAAAAPAAVVPPDASVLVTDLNEQAMMVAEGQKKIDEEKAVEVNEEEFEDAKEYPVHKFGEEVPGTEAPAAMEEPAQTAVEEEPPVEPAREEAPASSSAPATNEIRVSPEMLEEIVRKVVSELAPSLVTKIAWEVIPELADSLIKKRIEELEKEAE